jgi:hypothetical protein
MKNLKDYKNNVHSQHGEDGIIEEILRRLSHDNDFQYCEFGAWDGIHLSNTCALIKKNDCKALLIEPNKEKYNELCKNFPSDKIIKLNNFVEVEGKNSLDNLLKENEINLNFDFLSIDVDSIDYYIFESLKIYKPKVICIEFNPTIPNEVYFVQKNNASINQGSSAKALIELASKKKYFAVCSTKTNLFFVHEDFKKNVIGDVELSIDDLINDKNVKNFIFYGYDGSIFTSKQIRLPWHNFFVKDINQLNKYLRKYPRNYNFFEKVLFRILLRINNFFNKS